MPPAIEIETAQRVLGGVVTFSSLLAFLVRFSPEAETEAQRGLGAAVESERRRRELAPELQPAFTA